MLRPTRQHVYPVLLASVFALGCDASTSPPAAPADLVGAATLIPAGSTGGYAILSLPVGGTESLADQTQSTKTLRRLSRTTSYASADRNVATVTSRGLVTGVANGGTLVTATAGTLVDTVIVKVGTGPSALNFSIDTVRFREIGIQSTVAPTDARYKPVFTSLDPAIASVTTTGTITSVANGNTTVRVTNLVGATGSIAVAVAVPVVVPPPPASLTVAALLHRRDGASGSALVSSGVPFAPGVIRPGTANRLRVLVGGIEQRIYTEELAGRHKDGSVRAVLIQFPYSVTAGTDVSAQIVLADTPRSVSLPKPSDYRGNPSIAVLPRDATYLTSLDFLGPTLTVAEAGLRFGPLGQRFDADFVQFSTLLYSQLGGTWTENYYDRTQAYYAMWMRSGNPLYWDRAVELLLNYRKDYLEANNYGTSPHWSQVDGLGLHYLTTGDDSSRYAISRITQTLWYFRVRVGLGTKTSTDLENRIRARVLMAHLWLWRLSDAPATVGTELEEAYGAVLGAQEADGSYKFTAYCNQSLNYMDGMLNEALIQIYTHYKPDPRILTSVTQSTNWLWTQWIPASQGFKYVPTDCPGTGDTIPVPELNNLILNGYAWVFAQTGNQSAASRSDAIFQGGIEKSFLYGSKQFNQQYTTGWRFFGYRSGLKQ